MAAFLLSLRTVSTPDDRLLQLIRLVSAVVTDTKSVKPNRLFMT